MLPPANPKGGYFSGRLQQLKEAKPQKEFLREAPAGLTGLAAMLHTSGQAPACSPSTAVPFRRPTTPLRQRPAQPLLQLPPGALGRDGIRAPMEKPRGASATSGYGHKGIPSDVLRAA